MDKLKFSINKVPLSSLECMDKINELVEAINAINKVLYAHFSVSHYKQAGNNE